MQSLFGLELSTAQKVIVASVVILVLLALLGLFVRQIQGGRLRLRGQAGGRQRQPRLGVVDTYDLDRQRQLVLIRRDNIEHLVMIGGASDVVVETNILRSGARSPAQSYAETAAPDRPLPPFESLVPPQEPAVRAGDEVRRGGPDTDAPDVLPPLPSRPASAPAELAAAAAASAGVAAALGVAANEPSPAPAKPSVPPVAPPPVTTGPAPSFAREHAPPPAVSAGELDDMTRQLEEALKRPFSAVRPANLPSEVHPESVAPVVRSPVEVAKPAAEKPVAEPPKRPAEVVAPAARPSEPAPQPVAPPIPVVPPAPPARQSPLPSDVEAELAAALGLKPERAAPAAPEPKPVEAKVQPAAAKPGPIPAELEPLTKRQPEPEEPAAVAHKAPGEEKPVAEEAHVPKQDAKPEAEKKQAEPEPKEIDPFSVDAIEAEFARLLGRDPKAKS